MTNILGNAVATAEQMATYLTSKNPKPLLSRNITILDFCKLWLTVCAKEGVRGDIAFAQACKETGYFKYGGDVKYTQNNFAGIGATGGVPGNSFTDIETGILAQVQHLKTYATKANLNCACVDPRRSVWFVNAKGGTSPYVETLSGTWAVPGFNTTKYKSLDDANKSKDSYGYQIIQILNDILKIVVKSEVKNNMGYTLKTNLSNRANYGNIRNTSQIKYICIHYTANDGDHDESNGNYFHNNVVKASAHYFVDSDSITQSVPDNYVAWSVGGSKYASCSKTGGGKYYGICNNTNSISIELCDDVKNGIIRPSQKTIDNAIAFTKELMKKYNISAENVIRHFDVVGKLCPAYWCGNANNDKLWLTEFKNKLSNTTTASTPKPTNPTPAPTPTPSQPAFDFIGTKYTVTKGSPDISLIVKNLEKSMNYDYKNIGINLNMPEDGTIDGILLAHLGNTPLNASSPLHNVVYSLQQIFAWWGFIITPSGTYDATTVDIVKKCQAAWGLPVNGIVDKAFWYKILGK